MQRLFPLVFIFLFVLTACSGGEEVPGAANPTIAVDSVCEGILNNTFMSRENLQASGEEDNMLLSPYRVSFLLDGRVIWNYENNESYIGTFTCEQGAVTATFTEGSKQSFIGQYDPQAGTVVIDEIIYFVDTDV